MSRSNIFHEICEADSGVETGQNMDVIRHAVNSIKMALPVFQNTPYVAEKVRSPVLFERRPTLFGGEDDVITNLCIR